MLTNTAAAPIVIHIHAAMIQHRKVATLLGIRLGGRPTKYNERLAPFAFAILTDFRVVATMGYVAALLGISRSTLYEWMKLYPDMKAAIDTGKAVQECWLATCLVNGCGDPQGIFILLCNLHGWRRNGRRSEDARSSLREALETQATGARRVQWDRVMPVGDQRQLQ